MIRLHGRDKLESNLRRFLAETVPRLTAAAATAGAKRFTTGAQRRAPKAYGRLAASIHAEATRTNTATRRSLAPVTTDAPGAAAQELGTAHTPAQPFMRPTGHEDADAILSDAADHAARAMK